MNATENMEEAVEVLQQLGLKEYEARCFVGLSRLSTGTAKKLSEITEVPRTRVYDAIRVLEAQGLVQIQHSSPQKYRAVSLDEATETLRDHYENRIQRLHDALDPVEIIDSEEDTLVQQVWAMSGRHPIENRVNQLLTDATDEIVFVVGDEFILTEELVDTLNSVGSEVDLLIGALSEELQNELRTAVPSAKTFVSGLDWLHSKNGIEDNTGIGRLLLVDRSVLLVSSIVPDSGEEQAIFGEGFGNGLVVIARRLMSQGLLSARDPNK